VDVGCHLAETQTGTFPEWRRKSPRMGACGSSGLT